MLQETRTRHATRPLQDHYKYLEMTKSDHLKRILLDRFSPQELHQICTDLRPQGYAHVGFEFISLLGRARYLEVVAEMGEQVRDEMESWYSILETTGFSKEIRQDLNQAGRSVTLGRAMELKSLVEPGSEQI